MSETYFETPTRPVICRRCGAVVDVLFTPEHDRFHAALAVGERVSPPGTPGEDAAEPTFGDLAERRRAEEDYYDGMGE